VIARALGALAGWSWDGAKVLSPESAGFFVGAAIARRHGLEHAVVATDARRLPTSEVTAGHLGPRDRVVLVNDVGSTGAGLEPMLAAVERAGAEPLGVLLFAVVGAETFAAWCNQRGLPRPLPDDRALARGHPGRRHLRRLRRGPAPRPR
jgi:adenine/guanine phosphoribosyltransferase-like PRPP-binding protein